jgi:L-aspartate oxidase
VVSRAIAARHTWLDCRHLGEDLLEREFPTVMKACRAAGIDPRRDLIPVTPAAHYFIGGVQTDLDGRSSIPRLYAVGECSATGVHGANRLAGNSLAEALVFARRAARAIEGQRHRRTKARPEPPDLQDAGVDVVWGWKRIRQLCDEALGIEREPQALQGAEDALEEFSRTPPSGDLPALELRSAATVARLIARSAALRTESRGVHHRRDHPDPDPRWAGVRLRFART